MSYTSSISSSTGLSSTFLNLINNLMEIESQPLTRLEEKKDTITVQKAVYTDLNNMLTDFQTSVKSLLSTDSSYSFSAKNNVSVNGVAEGSTVLTASASSSAIPSDYQVAVTSLAKQHRVSSDKLMYSNQRLDYSGTFLLGGTGAAAATLSSGIVGTMESVNLASVDNDQTELGNGTYYVETRQDSQYGWQFRLVDAEGNAVKIQKSDGTYTTGWQAITAGVYDTGRGLTLNFGSDPEQYQVVSRGSGAGQIQYQAKGTEITIDADDALTDIAYKINSANYAENEDVVATIMDNQLILSRKMTGANRTITASDKTGTVLSQLGILENGSLKHVLQTASNAVFTVNDMSISRSTNTGLTDVIQGVTLNLASDAEGKSATVAVKYDPKGQQDILAEFIKKFNSLIKYLSAKVATEKKGDGTYSRGALSGDTMFQSLRLDLLQAVTGSINNGGEFTGLREIGITLGNDLSMSISSSADLQKALTNDMQGVTSLLDGIMTKLQNKLGRFLGTSGYMSTANRALESQLDSTNDRISTMEGRLTLREQALVNQYANIQAQLYTMSYTQSTLASFYSS